MRKGAPVWIFGTEVGSVKNINLDPLQGAIVTISIDKSVQTFIKKDAQASILTMGLLGDKYIELSSGSPLAEPIHSGEMIKGGAQIEFSDIMGTASIVIGKMGEFITKLDNLVVKMEKSQGTVAKFFTDPAVYDNLSQTTKMMSQILEDIKNSRGTMKMLIEDPSLYNKLLTATSSIEEFSKRLNEGTGTLKKLIEDPSLYNKTLFTISRIEEFSKKLNESHGTLKQLVEDPELYENLNRGSKQLSSILERIDKGEGLAGAFLKNEEFVRELSDALLEFKKLSVELEALVKDIKEHPKKYLKFSIF